MPDHISIETPDATSAALLMRETVGRMRARLQQCAEPGWRVLVLSDQEAPIAVRDVISLVRGLLRGRELDDVTVRHGDRCFALRGRQAGAVSGRRVGSAASGGCSEPIDEPSPREPRRLR